MDMMIEVQDLTKYYGPTLAISRLNFEVAQGEIVGFLGPNGAGKTTTLKILSGFLSPSSGTARINGRDCVNQSLEVRQSLGYLPETVPLYTDLTVSQFLRFAARAKGVEAKGETAEMARVMAGCGLEAVQNTLIASLSKGFRQRVIIVNRGQIVASDTPENLSRQLGHGSRVRLTVQGPENEVAAALEKIPQVQEVAGQGEGKFLVVAANDLDMRPQLARLVVERGWDLLELKAQEFTLEEVFLNLVTEEESAEKTEEES